MIGLPPFLRKPSFQLRLLLLSYGIKKRRNLNSLFAHIPQFIFLESYRSLYAEGLFGIVQEFYVIPEYRSQNVGSGLLKEIIKFAESKGWKRLELCTPPVPEFEKTVDFYKSNGFQITGGYKMKYVIT